MQENSMCKGLKCEAGRRLSGYSGLRERKRGGARECVCAVCVSVQGLPFMGETSDRAGGWFGVRRNSPPTSAPTT